MFLGHVCGREVSETAQKVSKVSRNLGESNIFRIHVEWTIFKVVWHLLVKVVQTQNKRNICGKVRVQLFPNKNLWA